MSEQSSDYIALAFTDLNAPPMTDRRDFLKLLGGGIIVFVTLGPRLFAQDPQRRRGGGRRGASDFNAFLRVGEDGSITCFTGKVEMGQGILTSLPQMLAEELDVPVDSIHMVMGDTDLCPWDMGTFGSMTTRFFGPSLRTAGAEAKSVLLDLAAEHLALPREQLVTRQGYVLAVGDDSKRVGYGELAKGQKIERTVNKAAVLKSIKQHAAIGVPRVSTEALDKAMGKAQYSGDIRLPGMLYARILRPPAHNAKLTSIDLSAAEEDDEVLVIEEGDLVAVLAEAPDIAEAALDKIKTDWEIPESDLNEETIFAHILAKAPKPQRLASGGDLAAGEKRAAQSVESTYKAGYVAHAPMECHTAVASLEDGKMTVWASTQTPFSARDEVARALEMPGEQVRVITPFVGGGFGGKAANPQVVEAARLAKLVEAPVHLEWTRAEEFFYDSFRPAAVFTVNSAIDDKGRLITWDYAVHAAGSRGAQQFYSIENHKTQAYGRGWSGGGLHPFNVGAWRAPACSGNCFARESQMDIMAALAQVDPYEFRMQHLDDQRMRTVLEATAKAFAWDPKPGPSGRGIGMACGIDAGTYVANMVEVEVNKDSGEVQVKRVVCAQDMGLVINPRGAIMQMEGCITQGLGYVFSEEIQFEGGAIKNKNFDSYELPRFSWVPEIETILVDTGIEEAHGGGEPAIIGMGAAIANAIHDAIGLRLYQLPMTPARIKAALG